jgi:hypothetical protein
MTETELYFLLKSILPENADLNYFKNFRVEYSESDFSTSVGKEHYFLIEERCDKKLISMRVFTAEESSIGESNKSLCHYPTC